MNNLFEKLYEEMYSPKITPQQLIDNAKISHYSHVNFKFENDFLHVETKCKIDEELANFYYIFDKEDHLLTLTSVIGDKEKIIYNRENAIKELRMQITKELNRKKEAIAM